MSCSVRWRRSKRSPSTTRSGKPSCRSFPRRRPPRTSPSATSIHGSCGRPRARRSPAIRLGSMRPRCSATSEWRSSPTTSPIPRRSAAASSACSRTTAARSCRRSGRQSTPPTTRLICRKSNQNVDAIFLGSAGSNSLRFLRQRAEYGLKIPIVGAQTVSDEAILRNMGDEAPRRHHHPLVLRDDRHARQQEIRRRLRQGERLRAGHIQPPADTAAGSSSSRD